MTTPKEEATDPAASNSNEAATASTKDANPGHKTPTGPNVIAKILKNLPSAPGVYRMLDTEGTVLYVGKAKSLKNRVASYTRLNGHSNRIARMISATASMEVITTKTEAEALLLEANLIKRMTPRYNVLLRDDKSFPYILVTKDHDAPQILKHRGTRKRKGDYFGPFASAGAVNATLNTLQRAFLLRTCTDTVYENRSRPCLLYQIKRCSAPCTGEISLDDYAALVKEAASFLTGKGSHIRDALVAKMEEASENLEFERAANYRDRIQAMSHVQQHQKINPSKLEEADVFGIHEQGGQVCVQVFFFRNFQNWGNRAFFPKADKTIPADEILESFIAQFYDDKPCPTTLLLSTELPNQDLLAEALSTRLGRRVSLLHPKRGEKQELVEYATRNAKEALARRLAETSSQAKLLAGVAAAFGMDKTPKRIEIYDNSHIQGTSAIGAMVVAGPEGFVKNQYRKFNIKSEALTPGDDYGMMREVLTRRFSRLLKEHGEKREEQDEDADLSLPPWPDLLLIDGGAGQLSATHQVLDELEVTGVNVVSIAKGPDRNAGRERFFIKGKPPHSLEPRDPVLYFVQRLRDEAHRFAIGSHRAKRKKNMGSNPLDEVAGIGPLRKRALLKHFGSAKAVSRAGVEDLTAVEGISAAMAQNIYDHFNDSQ